MVPYPHKAVTGAGSHSRAPSAELQQVHIVFVALQAAQLLRPGPGCCTAGCTAGVCRIRRTCTALLACSCCSGVPGPAVEAAVGAAGCDGGPVV